MRIRQLQQLILLFIVSGCTTLHMNTHEDQVASLEKYELEDINALVMLPGSDAKKRLSPKDFLIIHSGIVIAGEDLDQKKLRESFSSHIGNSENGMNSFQLNFSFKDELYRESGSCVPISSDGYFLTATHIINKSNSFVICLSSEKNKPYFDLSECRVVMMDKSTDFAVFKAEVITPWYLPMQNEPLDFNEIVFAGGWWHKRGGGKCIDTEMTLVDTDGKHIKHYRITTSIPIIPGDSGSPLINQRGELCGIMLKSSVRKSRKLPPKSEAVFLDVEFINELIDNDRLQIGSQQGAASHTASQRP